MYYPGKHFWDDKPFVRLLIPVLIGIIAEAHLKLELGGVIIACLTLFSILIVGHAYSRFKKRLLFKGHFGALTFVLLILLGFAITEASITQYRSDFFMHEYEPSCMLICDVIETPSAKRKHINAKLEIVGLHKKGTMHPCTGRLLCYIARDSLSLELRAGDRISFSEEVKPVLGPMNPGEFDYRNYLYGKGIYQRVFLPAGRWANIKHKTTGWGLSYFQRTRETLLERLRQTQISDQAYGVVAALVLGKKNELNTEVFESYSTAGVMHVLAVSGLHVGLIYLVIVWLTRFLDKQIWMRLLRLLLILIVIWCYACLTGLSASVSRAATMFSCVAISKVIDRKSNIYNTLALSALVLSLMHPFIVMEVGFQLSYSAVLGIVYFQPKISRFWNPTPRLVKKGWELAAVSLSAQLATFPISLFYFQQFPNYFLISNLIIIPGATVILYVGLLYFVTSFNAAVSGVLAQLLDALITFLNLCIEQIQHLPYPTTKDVHLSIIEVALLYGIIITTAMILVKKKAGWILLALGLILLGIGLKTQRKWMRIEQQEVVIHHIREHLAISIFDGEQGYVVFSNGLDTLKQKQNFHLQRYWNDRGDSQPTWLSIDELEKGKARLPSRLKYEHGLITTPSFCIRLVNQRWPVNKWEDIYFDALVVFGKQYPMVYEDIQSTSTKHLWIGSEVSSNVTERIVNMNVSASYHIANQTGALQLNSTK